MKLYTEAPVLPELASAQPGQVQEALWGAAVELGFPAALWRLPQSDTVFLAITLQKTLPQQEPQLENSRPGFCFCPFAPAENQPNLHLPADLFYSSAYNRLSLHPDAADSGFVAGFLKTVKKRLAGGEKAGWHLPKQPPHISGGQQGQYTALVEKCIHYIRSGAAEKLVPSRCKPVALPKPFDLLQAYQKLLQRYPGAFVSLVTVPEIGTWMGATPETLVEIDQHQVFRTMALAGTQKLTEGSDPAQALWGQKEIQEQRMVERYIINCFKKIRLRDYTEYGPRTVAAGNLMHLRTDFSADLKKADYATVGTDMLRMLHPTSAVSGMPREAALEFLLQHEGYDRGYFSGFLGPVQIQQESHIYVNLRCLQLLQHEAVLYAGAGVTAESVPAKEFTETELKMETMLGVINNQ